MPKNKKSVPSGALKKDAVPAQKVSLLHNTGTINEGAYWHAGVMDRVRAALASGEPDHG